MAVEILVSVMLSSLPEGLTEARLEELARRCAQTTMMMEGREADADELSVVFVDDDYIRGLNSRYLHKDEPTDVLAFSMMETSGDEPAEMEEGASSIRMLGDVVVSIDTAMRQAAEYGHTLEREVSLLVIHGTLHLLGYDDGAPGDAARMGEAQDRILAVVGF